MSRGNSLVETGQCMAAKLVDNQLVTAVVVVVVVVVIGDGNA